ncbi:HIT family protein [Croceicoccus bisphenolivorans]|uniref:HIT family protein n=1 Tax=Croceicoccus bisphenolivorans TaxID=1783232 RepID=UPI0008352D41|nr:HIT family protein [Croceicoccus bisphenolivorans]
MNETIRKFGYPATLIHEYEHWVALLRPAQPTLGSLVLAAKSDVTEFHALPATAFAELETVTTAIETTLKAFIGYERINYLMLMMVDPHVHFHVIPRYEGAREWQGATFEDKGWPAVPVLGEAIKLGDSDLSGLVADLKAQWS